ncbi:MAG: hypothetical protein WC971_08520 [Coriobacteriia bacterium]
MLAELKRILVTVKTYPNPSAKYDETVCTAGIDLATGRLIRLYPVRFRDLPFIDQFKKWDVIEIEVKHKGSDPRGDTWTPVGDSYTVVDHVGTGCGKPPDWKERKDLTLPLVTTIEELRPKAEAHECSLGVVRVHGPAILKAVPDPGEWDEGQRQVVERQQLFGRSKRPLERVPWRFMYTFRCSDGCGGHTYQLFDWEAYALYRGQLAKKGDPDAAAADVENQYNVRLGTPSHDVCLFVGTHYLRHAQFSAIGVFYPPRM